MGNIFKVFLSLSALTVLSSCDVFLGQNDDGFECESNLKKVYEKTSLNNFEQTKFKDLLVNRFPKYREMFEQASIKTTIDSDLLAAISFHLAAIVYCRLDHQQRRLQSTPHSSTLGIQLCVHAFESVRQVCEPLLHPCYCCH